MTNPTRAEIAADMERQACELEKQGKWSQAKVLREAIAKLSQVMEEQS